MESWMFQLGSSVILVIRISSSTEEAAATSTPAGSVYPELFVGLNQVTPFPVVSLHHAAVIRAYVLRPGSRSANVADLGRGVTPWEDVYANHKKKKITTSYYTFIYII